MLTLRFGHSHVYPGALARLDAALPDEDEMPCLVEFADGMQVPARLAGGRDVRRLSVAEYTTARGTFIPAKRWSLSPFPNGNGGTTLRVTSRAADP
jgi:hypothetical protein